MKNLDCNVNRQKEWKKVQKLGYLIFKETKHRAAKIAETIQ